MRMPHSVSNGDRPVTHIHVGGTFASVEPFVVRTILGSCIAVCLRDPVARIGGMNHFMLPNRLCSGGNPASYGLYAMELLINKCMGLGAQRSRLEAKVFGGGQVLKLAKSPTNVADRNIAFALDFLFREQVPILKMDVGGYAGREVFYFTDTGKTMVRRMEETGIDRSEETIFDEESHRRELAIGADENVTLFERRENEIGPRTYRR